MPWVTDESWLALGSLFLSSFISSTVAPGGSEVVLAYLVASKEFQISSLVLIATVGNTLGAMTTWGLGLIAAGKFPLSSMLSTKHRKAHALIQRHGTWVLLFSWLPILGDAFCFAGGWLKLPISSGILAIFLGKLCRYAAIAWLFV